MSGLEPGRIATAWADAAGRALAGSGEASESARLVAAAVLALRAGACGAALVATGAGASASAALVLANAEVDNAG
jgi:hypothetical protein